ncbi:MAG TPA: trigger factor [Candidatus Limivicinus faecipullorum]|mgnify:FL=1|nr:trigger factor [Candidatus Limivicinus faecipullorum]
MTVKNVEKKENNTAAFQVETDAAEFEAAVNGAYLKNKSSIYIPGFRKGKAPRAVVEGMYGHEVFYQDAMDELAPKAFDQGLKESGLRIVGAPAISDVKVTDERTVEYTFEVTLYPEVTLGQYKGLSAQKDAVNVTDEDVDKELEAARKRSARILTVDDREARMGDTANIDFDGYLNGERFDGGKAEGHDLELGSGSFVPGFEEQVVGMKIGEEKDVNITFPQDYVADLAGKDVVFKVKLNSLSTRELPELDDEFAKDVSEFDTLDEYKADIRAKQEKQQQELADNKFRSDIIRKACENMTVDIPAVMIDDKLEEMVRNYAANFGFTDRNTSLEDLLKMMGVDAAAIRPSAEMQVKTELLLEAVVKAENMEVTQEDTEEYMKKVAEGIGAKVEDMKNYFSKEFIEEELKKERATNIIIDSAVVEEAQDKAE